METNFILTYVIKLLPNTQCLNRVSHGDSDI